MSEPDYRDFGPIEACLCGCTQFKILAKFYEAELVWYTNSGHCYQCGAAVTVPTPADATT